MLCICCINEFKSVIAQRLVVEQILPIEQIGAPEVRMAEGMTEEERDRALEAAKRRGRRYSSGGHARH